jgi:hypothetical protein
MIQDAFVAYFDVLGFTSRFISGDLTNRYERLIKAIREIEDQDLTIFLLSDSVVVISEYFERFKQITQTLYTWGILHDFWLRGAISQGSVTKPSGRIIVTDNTVILPFLGPAYLKAYALETTLNIAGVVIDETVCRSMKDGSELRENIDYIQYEEYLPKEGYEGKKLFLLPREHTMIRLVDTLYFEEMLKSHVEDIDKYVNTFCFYIKYILAHSDVAVLRTFLEKLLKEFYLQGLRVLIPSKVVVIFIAVIDGLVNRYRTDRAKGNGGYTDPAALAEDTGTIVATLREQGYLSAFIDYLLEFDRKRHTTLYKDVNSIQSGPEDFA